jgi:hypothetical protein
MLSFGEAGDSDSLSDVPPPEQTDPRSISAPPDDAEHVDRVELAGTTTPPLMPILRLLALATAAGGVGRPLLTTSLTANLCPAVPDATGTAELLVAAVWAPPSPSI